MVQWKQEEPNPWEWEFHTWEPPTPLMVRNPQGARVATLARRMMGLERARARQGKSARLLVLLRGKRRTARQEDGAARALVGSGT